MVRADDAHDGRRHSMRRERWSMKRSNAVHSVAPPEGPLPFVTKGKKFAKARIREFDSRARQAMPPPAQSSRGSGAANPSDVASLAIAAAAEARLFRSTVFMALMARVPATCPASSLRTMHPRLAAGKVGRESHLGDHYMAKAEEFQFNGTTPSPTAPRSSGAISQRSASEAFAHGVAVITGAGAGIGAGLAQKLAAQGMTVVVADICPDRAVGTVAAVAAEGGKAHAFTVDVSRADELDRLAAEVADRFGDVRMLINNAGIETVGFSWEIPASRWDATLDINIHGVVHGCRAFLPAMIAGGQECWIANVASVGGFGQMPIQTSYIMSKHAVQSFTECLSLEIELSGAPVHVASVIPGMVRTHIFDATDADLGQVAVGHRTVMRETMAAHGMDIDMACQRIVDQLATGAFWVSTQPRMTRMFLDTRVEFLREQRKPRIADELASIFKDISVG